MLGLLDSMPSPTWPLNLLRKQARTGLVFHMRTPVRVIRYGNVI